MMRPSDESIADFASGGWILAVLGGLLAGASGLAGLLVLILQWWAGINMNFANLTHLGVFGFGWLTVATCFVSAWKLLRGDSYRNLLWTLPPVLLMTLLFWLWSLPGARGLAH